MSKFLVLNNLDQLECYVAGSTGTIGLLLRRTLVRSVRYLAFGTLIANCHQQIHVQQRSLVNAEQQIAFLVAKHRRSVAEGEGR